MAGRFLTNTSETRPARMASRSNHSVSGGDSDVWEMPEAESADPVPGIGRPGGAAPVFDFVAVAGGVPAASVAVPRVAAVSSTGSRSSIRGRIWTRFNISSMGRASDQMA